MIGFLYYLPNQTGVFNTKAIPGLGLTYAFEAGRCSNCEVFKGPDGGRGTVISPGDEGVGYYPDRQTWRKMPGSPNWIGMYNDNRPGPADLARLRLLNGHSVTLGDEQAWTVPLARAIAVTDKPVPYIALPTVASIDDEGNWIQGDVVPRYRRLWEIARHWWDAVIQADGAGEAAVSFDYPGLMSSAVEVLQANYRIGPAEASLLGLLTDQVAVEVLNALVDWPTLTKWLSSKKVEAAGSKQSGSQEG